MKYKKNSKKVLVCLVNLLLIVTSTVFPISNVFQKVSSAYADTQSATAIDSVYPSNIYALQQGSSLFIKGSNLCPGFVKPTVKIGTTAIPDSDIYVMNTDIVQIKFPNGFNPGTYDVTVAGITASNAVTFESSQFRHACEIGDLHGLESTVIEADNMLTNSDSNLADLFNFDFLKFTTDDILKDSSAFRTRASNEISQKFSDVGITVDPAAVDSIISDFIKTNTVDTHALGNEIIKQYEDKLNQLTNFPVVNDPVGTVINDTSAFRTMASKEISQKFAAVGFNVSDSEINQILENVIQTRQFNTQDLGQSLQSQLDQKINVLKNWDFVADPTSTLVNYTSVLRDKISTDLSSKLSDVGFTVNKDEINQILQGYITTHKFDTSQIVKELTDQYTQKFNTLTTFSFAQDPQGEMLKYSSVFRDKVSSELSTKFSDLGFQISKDEVNQVLQNYITTHQFDTSQIVKELTEQYNAKIAELKDWEFINTPIKDVVSDPNAFKNKAANEIIEKFSVLGINLTADDVNAQLDAILRTGQTDPNLIKDKIIESYQQKISDLLNIEMVKNPKQFLVESSQPIVDDITKESSQKLAALSFTISQDDLEKAIYSLNFNDIGNAIVDQYKTKIEDLTNIELVKNPKIFLLETSKPMVDDLSRQLSEKLNALSISVPQDQIENSIYEMDYNDVAQSVVNQLKQKIEELCHWQIIDNPKQVLLEGSKDVVNDISNQVSSKFNIIGVTIPQDQVKDIIYKFLTTKQFDANSIKSEVVNQYKAKIEGLMHWELIDNTKDTVISDLQPFAEDVAQRISDKLKKDLHVDLSPDLMVNTVMQFASTGKIDTKALADQIVMKYKTQIKDKFVNILNQDWGITEEQLKQILGVSDLTQVDFNDIKIAVGNVTVNDVLKFAGPIIINKAKKQAWGSGTFYMASQYLNGPKSNPNIQFDHYNPDGLRNALLDTALVSIASGRFEIDPGKILKAGGLNNFSLYGTRVDIENLSFVRDDTNHISGVKIAGNLVLPAALKNTSVSIDNLELTKSGAKFAGGVQIPELTFGGYGLKNTTMSIDTANKDFMLDTTLSGIPYVPALMATVSIQNGKLHEIGLGADNTAIPIGTTGFFLDKLYGRVSGFDIPPMEFMVQTTLTGPFVDIAGKRLRSIAATDLTVKYRTNGELEGSGNFEVLSWPVGSGHTLVRFKDGWEVDGTINILDVLIAQGQIEQFKSKNESGITGFAIGDLHIPKNIPIPAIGGMKIAQAEAKFDNTGLQGKVSITGLGNYYFAAAPHSSVKFGAFPVMATLDENTANNGVKLNKNLDKAIIGVKSNGKSQTSLNVVTPDGTKLTPTMKKQGIYFTLNKATNQAFYIIDKPEKGVYKPQVINSRDYSIYILDASRDAIKQPVSTKDQKILEDMSTKYHDGLKLKKHYMAGNMLQTVLGKLPKSTTYDVSGPSDLTVDGSNGIATLKFTPVNNSDIAGYRAYIYDSNGNPIRDSGDNYVDLAMPDTKDGFKIAALSNLGYDIKTKKLGEIEYGKNYFVEVRPYNSLGVEGSAGNKVTFSVTDPVSAKINGSVLTGNDGSYVINTHNLSFDVNSASGISTNVYVNQKLENSGLTGIKNLNLTMNEGINDVTLETVNAEGVKNYKTFVVDADTFCDLGLESLKDGITTNTKNFNVIGTTETSAKVEIKVNGTVIDSAVPVDITGKFSKTVNLNEGDNQIEIIATDIAGNVKSENCKVCVDSIAPTLTADYVADATLPTGGKIVGKTDADNNGTVQVFVNEKAVQIQPDGSFSVNIDSSDACQNPITLKKEVIVRAADIAGNNNIQRVEVFGVPSNLKINLTRSDGSKVDNNSVMVGDNINAQINLNGYDVSKFAPGDTNICFVIDGGYRTSPTQKNTFDTEIAATSQLIINLGKTADASHKTFKLGSVIYGASAYPVGNWVTLKSSGDVSAAIAQLLSAMSYPARDDNKPDSEAEEAKKVADQENLAKALQIAKDMFGTTGNKEKNAVIVVGTQANTVISKDYYLDHSYDANDYKELSNHQVGGIVVLGKRIGGTNRPARTCFGPENTSYLDQDVDVNKFFGIIKNNANQVEFNGRDKVPNDFFGKVNHWITTNLFHTNKDHKYLGICSVKGENLNPDNPGKYNDYKRPEWNQGNATECADEIADKIGKDNIYAIYTEHNDNVTGDLDSWFSNLTNNKSTYIGNDPSTAANIGNSIINDAIKASGTAQGNMSASIQKQNGIIIQTKGWTDKANTLTKDLSTDAAALASDNLSLTFNAAGKYTIPLNINFTDSNLQPQKTSIDITKDLKAIYGNINIGVYDQNGDAIKGAKLSVVGPNNKNAQTDDNGKASIGNLTAGTYSVAIDNLPSGYNKIGNQQAAIEINSTNANGYVVLRAEKQLAAPNSSEEYNPYKVNTTITLGRSEDNGNTFTEQDYTTGSDLFKMKLNDIRINDFAGITNISGTITKDKTITAGKISGGDGSQVNKVKIVETDGVVSIPIAPLKEKPTDKPTLEVQPNSSNVIYRIRLIENNAGVITKKDIYFKANLKIAPKAVPAKVRYGYVELTKAE